MQHSIYGVKVIHIVCIYLLSALIIAPIVT